MSTDTKLIDLARQCDSIARNERKVGVMYRFPSAYSRPRKTAFDLREHARKKLREDGP